MSESPTNGDRIVAPGTARSNPYGSTLPGPGWYPDPEAPLVQQRLWDGGAWTKDRRALTVPTSAAVPLPPPVGPLTGGGRSKPLTLAGALFVIAGVGATLTPLIRPLTLPGAIVAMAGDVVFYLGLAAAYAVFWRARFPHRSRTLSVVLPVVVLSYVLIVPPFVVLQVTGASWTSPVILLLAVVAGIGAIVFASSVNRNRLLPRGIRTLPVVQYGLFIAANLIVRTTGFDMTGFVLIGIGAAYVILAADARAAVENAATAPAELRTGQPNPPARIPRP